VIGSEKGTYVALSGYRLRNPAGFLVFRDCGARWLSPNQPFGAAFSSDTYHAIYLEEVSQCWIRRTEQNVAAPLRRSVVAVQRGALQSKIETASCGWQST
jgi:hypothetical protein